MNARRPHIQGFICSNGVLTPQQKNVMRTLPTPCKEVSGREMQSLRSLSRRGFVVRREHEWDLTEDGYRLVSQWG